MFDVFTAKVGDKVREIGRATVLTVWRIEPPGSTGRAYRHGPSVMAHVRPGGYGVAFDAETADRFDAVT